MKLVERQRDVGLEHPFARRHPWPRPRHARPADATEKHDAHLHVRSTAKTDALERHAHFDAVAVRPHFARALPHPVGRHVFAVGSGVEPIHLNAARIDEHVIRHLAGAARVEADRDPIVVPRRVSAADRGANLLGFGVEALEGEIDGVLVVGNPHAGALRRRFAVDRVVRQPRVERQSRPRPCLIVQNAVEFGRNGHAQRAQLGALYCLAQNGRRDCSNSRQRQEEKTRATPH